MPARTIEEAPDRTLTVGLADPGEYYLAVSPKLTDTQLGDIIGGCHIPEGGFVGQDHRNVIDTGEYAEPQNPEGVSEIYFYIPLAIGKKERDAIANQFAKNAGKIVGATAIEACTDLNKC